MYLGFNRIRKYFMRKKRHTQAVELSKDALLKFANVSLTYNHDAQMYLANIHIPLGHLTLILGVGFCCGEYGCKETADKAQMSAMGNTYFLIENMFESYIDSFPSCLDPVEARR